jgi:ribosomal RNA-processing protein 17
VPGYHQKSSMPGEYMQKVAGVARKSGSAGRGRGGGKGNGRGQGKGGRSGGKGKDKPAKVKRVKEVVFDEGARKEHLLGMRKRKAERRKFGLDMQKFKDRKVILQERKERRELVREKYDEALALKNRRMQGHAFEEDETEDIMRGGLVRVLAGEAAVEEMELPASGTSETVFDDEHTSARFGDGVTVMTSFGLPDSDEEDGAKPHGLTSSDEEEGGAEEDGEEGTELTNAAKRRKLEGREDAKVTLFQRIQNKSKGRTLPKKRKGDKGKKRGDFVVDKKKQAIMGKKNTDKKKGAKTRMAKKNNVKGK